MMALPILHISDAGVQVDVGYALENVVFNVGIDLSEFLDQFLHLLTLRGVNDIAAGHPVDAALSAWPVRCDSLREPAGTAENAGRSLPSSR